MHPAVRIDRDDRRTGREGAPRSDEELMAAYVNGDNGSLDQLFRRHAPTLLRMLSRPGGPAEGQDLLQQTFLQLHRCRRDWRSDAPLRPWLFTIACNVKRERIRARRRVRAEPLDNPGLWLADPRHRPERATADLDARNELARLPSEQQQAIVLHWIYGFSFEEIAGQVGASVSAVKVRAHRGYEAMRRAFVVSWVEIPPTAWRR